MKNKIALLLALSVYIPSAYAHSLGNESMSLLNGLFHPLMGLDHILAMIAVGLWAAQLGGSALWRLPLSFMSMMVLAAVIAANGFSLPSAELLIAASVVCLGCLIALGIRLPLLVSMGLVGLFAMLHGYAHGLEMPHEQSAIYYGSGFVVATALLHITGIVLGKATTHQTLLSRLSGLMITLAGLYLVSTT
jgi:urease accessory protein